MGTPQQWKAKRAKEIYRIRDECCKKKLDREMEENNCRWKTKITKKGTQQKELKLILKQEKRMLGTCNVYALSNAKSMH